jgi:hypothetical protein
MEEAVTRHTFFNGNNISPVNTLLKHYAIRTVEQGYKKIMYDRQIHNGAGNHYVAIRDQESPKDHIVRPKNWGNSD